MPEALELIEPALGQESFPRQSHLTLSGIIIGPTVVTGLQFLAYGFYAMSFALCLLVLKQRPRTRERTFHLTTIIALFVLATLGLVVNTGLVIVQAECRFYERAGDGVEEHQAKARDLMGRLLTVFRILSSVLIMLAK
ncbi:hypothetical protein PM082_019727 [Marasmius tenuissimus]|nr:hypothetical protein PM082_019727 [Marasmius tenuissimus]